MFPFYNHDKEEDKWYRIDNVQTVPVSTAFWLFASGFAGLGTPGRKRFGKYRS
jgi:hypothetical protein